MNDGFMLTEGSCIELLKRIYNYDLHPELLNTAMLFEKQGRVMLELVYRAYIDAAFMSEFSIQMFTPTWRANREILSHYAPAYMNANRIAFEFMDSIRSTYKQRIAKISIAGLIGCKNDAYNPGESLDVEGAEEFHAFQIEELSRTGIDCIVAATIPSLTEASGIARAASRVGVPYHIGFVIRKNGTLLDGTPLSQAIERIDKTTENPPLSYCASCVHPKNVLQALSVSDNSVGVVRRRLKGIHGNASSLEPEELDNAEELLADPMDEWVDCMVKLKCAYGFTILGGCCGTNPEYIRNLGKALKRD